MGSESAFDEEIIDIFVEEVNEVLAQIDINVPLWQENPTNELPLKEVRRAFHTLKGSGRMVQAIDLAEVALAVESMLNRLIDKALVIQPEMYELVIEVRKALPLMLDAFKNRQAAVMSGVNFARYIMQSNDIIAGKSVQPLRGEANEQLSPEFLAHEDEEAPVPIVVEQTKPVEQQVSVQSAPDVSEFITKIEEQNALIDTLKRQLTSVDNDIDTIKAQLGAMPKASDPIAITRQLRQTDVDMQELKYFIKVASEKMMADNIDQQRKIEAKLDRETKTITALNKKIDTDMLAMAENLKADFANTVKLWVFVGAGCSVMITVLLLALLK